MTESREPMHRTMTHVTHDTFHVTRHATRDGHVVGKALRLRNIQIATDFLGKKLVNLGMAWDGGCSAVDGMPIDRVTSAFTQELAAVRLEMTHQLPALHSTAMEIGSSIAWSS